MLQGCIFSELKMAVKIAIGHGCHDKVNKISDAVALKDVHAAKACDDLDADKLSKFKVTSCKDVLHDMIHFLLGATCEYDVAEKAGKPCNPFSGAACKTAVDTAVKAFPQGDTGMSKSDAEPKAENDGTEAILGLVVQCSKVVITGIDGNTIQQGITEGCSTETDPQAMSAMNVDEDHCKDYIEQQLTEVGTIACVASAVTSEDAPETPDAVTFAWMEKSAQDFGKVFAQEPEKAIEDAVGSGPDRLRLYQALRQGKWLGKLRRWSPASVMTAWVASAFALVALMGVVWRCRSNRQPASQDMELILDEKLQTVE